MKVEHCIGNYRYTLSNEDIRVGDRVFPIISGRFDNGEMFFNKIQLPEDFSEPHTVTKIEGNYFYTDHGYSHKPRYFKIIKIERQMKDETHMFDRYFWEDVLIPPCLQNQYLNL